MEIIDECTELAYSIDENADKFEGEVIENKNNLVQEMPKMPTDRSEEKRSQTAKGEMGTSVSMQTLRLPIFRLSAANRNAETHIKCTTELI